MRPPRRAGKPLVKQALSGTAAGVRPGARPVLSGSFTILAAALVRRNNRAPTLVTWFSDKPCEPN